MRKLDSHQAQNLYIPYILYIVPITDSPFNRSFSTITRTEILDLHIPIGQRGNGPDGPELQ